MRRAYFRTAAAFGSLLVMAWAAFGAGASSDAKDPFTPQQRKYWAFQKIGRPMAPAKSSANPIRASSWASAAGGAALAWIIPAPPAQVARQDAIPLPSH